MKQKLIMENWRKFIESISLEEIDQKYESQLQEGLGTTLLTLVTFIVGGQKVELDKAEQTLAYGMMNKIEQQGDTYSGVPVEDIRSAFDDYMEAAQGSDYNGDGIAKGFLHNAGVPLKDFNKEVLRQVQQRLI